jgi:hypothetical protein
MSNGYFPKEIETLSAAEIKARMEWVRWIVPIEAVLLGLSVSLYKPENVQHHPHPSLLKSGWAFLALSLLAGVLAASASASVVRSKRRHLQSAHDYRSAAKVARDLELRKVYRPTLPIRICLVLCPILLAVGLGFLVLFSIWL